MCVITTLSNSGPPGSVIRSRRCSMLTLARCSFSYRTTTDWPFKSPLSSSSPLLINDADILHKLCFVELSANYIDMNLSPTLNSNVWDYQHPATSSRCTGSKCPVRWQTTERSVPEWLLLRLATIGTITTTSTAAAAGCGGGVLLLILNLLLLIIKNKRISHIMFLKFM